MLKQNKFVKVTVIDNKNWDVSERSRICKKLEKCLPIKAYFKKLDDGNRFIDENIQKILENNFW